MFVRRVVRYGSMRRIYTNLLLITSHNLSLRDVVRFSVPNRFLYAVSSVDQGGVEEKKVDSAVRACSQVTPAVMACELGHLTQNHDVVFSRSPRMNGSQFPSSAGGIRSGFVNTPENRSLLIVFQERCHIPIVLAPSGSNSLASRCAP